MTCGRRSKGAAADAVARAVGIVQIEADVLPDQEAEVVKRLQANGERVAASQGTRERCNERRRPALWGHGPVNTRSGRGSEDDARSDR